MSVSFAKKTRPYSHWEYSNTEYDSLIRIVPERGGLISEWRSEGKDLLYFDLERFLDEDKSVRGGIPWMKTKVSEVEYLSFSPYAVIYLRVI